MQYRICPTPVPSNIITKMVLGVGNKLQRIRLHRRNFVHPIKNGIRNVIFRIIEIITETVGRNSISIVKKLDNVEKANETGNAKGPAEVYEVQPKKVRYWKAKVEE